ncbi:acyltransferase family protein [Pseudomonas turukhanskensis]|uniref:Acyltransferase 3 domain-containing protein n=1 Tax=Pseudomonas turukhanskensis TaxID=1806536 RepID=A0A9W6NF62_9PSED|nr:acyltransferase [Pseudomonas turukhanskensis]GLK88512.1 hypothetical protein GCM10017655_15740 [Pseudomonas turukhanskensis]
MLAYRREIDGLRALAVLPVLLCHAGLGFFSGGFVGVDIFFVISGYLITSIILDEVQAGAFSFISFYERRARRILPALFVVMSVSTLFACLWMMPDELKNFGQSILATTLFSNNMLLAVTTGYWQMASEFKPLLHTWSLGVEEQYYLVFPLVLLFAWRRFKSKLGLMLALVFVSSLVLSLVASIARPDMGFYVLPTRAWELLAGAQAALYLRHHAHINRSHIRNQLLSGAGLALILASIVFFTPQTRTPGLYALIPTSGAVLIIFFATEKTLAHRLLASRVMVATGLISYSLYLWHQPLFAFARIYSVTPPSVYVYLGLIVATFLLAAASWKFVELPFRNRRHISSRAVWTLAVVFSLSFVAFGTYLDRSYGWPSRVFDASVKMEEMDKRIYNSRVFSYKKDTFATDNSLKILVVGDSFGRDLVNMMTESFSLKNVDVVYRDDLGLCLSPFPSETAKSLYNAAEVIVIARATVPACIDTNTEFARLNHKKLFYLGTKHFGYNLNWLVQLDRHERANRTNQLLATTVSFEKQMAETVPAENYISILAVTAINGAIPITDAAGQLLSTDRTHLTRYGAKYFGEKVIKPSPLGALIQAAQLAH